MRLLPAILLPLFLASSPLQQANTLYREGRFAVALERYRRLEATYTTEPEKSACKVNLANTLFMLGSYKQASDYYLSVIVNPATPDSIRGTAHYQLAHIYAASADLASSAKQRSSMEKQALEEFRNALRLDPEDRQTRENIEIMERRLKRETDVPAAPAERQQAITTKRAAAATLQQLSPTATGNSPTSTPAGTKKSQKAW
ncbi:tetratricopeptide repeat protein [Prosthecochloris vibrioformis]|uniref:Tetratricopeptide repeat protein n=1 Tax=Prosthecochloris vibrioformis TaxID=1098 RepID=A0A5C4S3R7_PROVB|nr:tetratricopeptide repeat protein [Prosthecochloris vibrioformis]TNJ37757.1 hypothetical protein FGF68_00845 [Prosthecochloris vibrioformis]